MLFHFSKDRHPGKLKILFIANAFSSHTHAWIDLLHDQEVNARLFSLPGTIPPAGWQVDAYVPARHWGRFNIQNRRVLYTFPNGLKKYRFTRMGVDFFERFLREYHFPALWLSHILKRWQPHIIHTLGLDPGAFLLMDVIERYALNPVGKWVATIRGGPDLALNRSLPEYADKIKRVFSGCDQVIADNAQNYQIALEMGLDAHKVCPLGAIPGAGGMDFNQLSHLQIQPPSQRERIILWPKGYESVQSKALPVFEALKEAWPAIQPCKIFITAVIQDEVRIWFEQLPEEVRKHCVMLGRIPRDELLELMARARVALSPSISDGVPNLLYESMAYGAMPIFSPLETIKTVVRAGKNCLFARNLYPGEISAALVRAMSDDSLVDAVSSRNQVLVRKLADRDVIREKVLTNYQALVRES